MIRGLHFQAEPKGETKLIRCQSGAIWDVMVDLRAGSATIGRWESFELTAGNRLQLYAPMPGCAHGMQCLTDNCEVFYQMSEFYAPEARPRISLERPELQHPLARGRSRGFGARPRVALVPRPSMRILVTGAAGFIGGSFARLARRGRPLCRRIDPARKSSAADGNLVAGRDLGGGSLGGDRPAFVRRAASTPLGWRRRAFISNRSKTNGRPGPAATSSGARQAPAHGG